MPLLTLGKWRYTTRTQSNQDSQDSWLQTKGDLEVMKKTNELVLELVKYEMETDNSCELTDAIIALFTEYGLRKMVNSSQSYDITSQLLCTVDTYRLETEIRERSKRDARQL